jgi:hypothetical protein
VSPSSSSPDRPSPKRLPGGRAFNLRRSVLGALGNLPSDLTGVKHPFGTMCRKLRQSRSCTDSRPGCASESCCDRGSGRLQGCAAAGGGGSERGIPLLRNPACEQQEDLDQVARANAVATAAAGAFRGVPPPEAGDPSAGFRSCGIPLANRKMHRGGGSFVRPSNRPPPRRLPVGGPSTSGAPSSVHTGHYDPRTAPSSGDRSPKGAVCDSFFRPSSMLRVTACALTLKGTMNSPSRVRFRPPSRLTFRFRVRPPGRASS